MFSCNGRGPRPMGPGLGQMLDARVCERNFPKVRWTSLDVVGRRWTSLDVVARLRTITTLLLVQHTCHQFQRQFQR